MSKLLIKNARLSYAHLFAPHAIAEGQDPKYSVSLLISKSDTATVNAIKSAIKATIEEGKSSKWNGKLPGNLKNPLRDGDDERGDDPNYEGMYFINCNAKNKPQVVLKQNGMLIGASEEDVYSGCYAAVTVTFFPYDAAGNRGIGAGLGNVLKMRDGERLGGGATAEQDFAELDIETEDDFSDLGL